MSELPEIALPNQPLLIEEAATALRMSVTTLRELRNKGQGPKARLVAGKLLFRVNDLDQWLEQQPES